MKTTREQMTGNQRRLQANYKAKKQKQRKEQQKPKNRNKYENPENMEDNWQFHFLCYSGYNWSGWLIPEQEEEKVAGKGRPAQSCCHRQSRSSPPVVVQRKPQPLFAEPIDEGRYDEPMAGSFPERVAH